jgi:hypothetical protein
MKKLIGVQDGVFETSAGKQSRRASVVDQLETCTSKTGSRADMLMS